jgi:hypothetical protein
MKKTNVKEIEFQKDQYGMTMYSSDYALSMIANTISNLEHGISRLAVDNNVSDETDVSGIEDRLEKLTDKVDDLIGVVSDISVELETLSTISETLENMLAFYIEFNQTKKTK